MVTNEGTASTARAAAPNLCNCVSEKIRQDGGGARGHRTRGRARADARARRRGVRLFAFSGGDGDVGARGDASRKRAMSPTPIDRVGASHMKRSSPRAARRPWRTAPSLPRRRPAAGRRPHAAPCGCGATRLVLIRSIPSVDDADFRVGARARQRGPQLLERAADALRFVVRRDDDGEVNVGVVIISARRLAPPRGADSSAGPPRDRAARGRASPA